MAGASDAGPVLRGGGDEGADQVTGPGCDGPGGHRRVGHGRKPDPEPYLLGADTLGLLPEACAAFEDSDTGTRAAVAAGCKVWQVPDLRPEGTQVPMIGQTLAENLADAVRDAGF